MGEDRMCVPLLSVIVPIYNSEKYLKECIHSILIQTYQNLEIILVNDGSSDSSEEIVLDYLEKDNRLHYISKKNGGVSTARNVGMKSANGDYITFVDSDDTLEKEMYQKMMDIIQLQDVDIVCCGYSKISLRGERTNICGTITNVELSGDEGIKHLLMGDLFTGSPCTKIYRKSILSGILFREELAINEDVYFNYCLMKVSQSIIYMQEPLYLYYEREGSATQISSDIIKFRDTMTVSELIYEDSIKTINENLARTKYIYALMNYYRLLLSEPEVNNTQEKRIISKKVKLLLKKPNNLHKKYILSFWGMLICPNVYSAIYKYYDKMRKPNWDINIQRRRGK